MATNIDLQEVSTNNSTMTEDEMRSEIDYIIAEQLLKNMLDRGLISLGEFNKVTELNAEKFSPILTSIMPTKP